MLKKNKQKIKNKKKSIQPLGFVLKYEPPIIGLLYKEGTEDKKKIYNIHLQNLMNLDDEVEITTVLFDEHPDYLNPEIIEPEQVLSLVQKLFEYKTLRDSQSDAFIQSETQSESQFVDGIVSIADEDQLY